MKKRAIFTAVNLLVVMGLMAQQGDGSAGIQEATQMITSYFDPATKLIYAIGAVVGLIGGVKWKILFNLFPLFRFKLTYYSC